MLLDEKFKSRIWFLRQLNTFIFQMAFIAFLNHSLHLLVFIYIKLRSSCFINGRRAAKVDWADTVIHIYISFAAFD